jgi:hypothetical protein
MTVKAVELDAVLEMIARMNFDLSVRTDGDTTTIVLKKVSK